MPFTSSPRSALEKMHTVMRERSVTFEIHPPSDIDMERSTAITDRFSIREALGVPWGRTLHAMVHGLPALPPSTVVQIVGNVPTSDLTAAALLEIAPQGF